MWFELTYKFLGGLGLFFFGMSTLSEALQSMAGDLIRKVINTLTTNRLMAVGVGAFVTMLVQSSSVTTVMIVGLVNANLMELTQAIGVIFGANIGTTITGWILALKVGKYGLLFIGLGIFPYLFAKKTDFVSIGRLLIALGFIFIGLETMSGAFKPLRHTQGFRDMLVYFSADTIPTFLACVGMGAILTCIIQSSSAMLGVTVALAATGAITFQTAAALVLGENIGTTITALLASINTNAHAKRAARGHAIFNVLGVLWLTPLFWYYTELIDWLIPGVPDFVAPDGTKPYIATHIASSHSLFNVVNTLVFLPFVNHIARFVSWLTPAPKFKETAHLKFLPSAVSSSPPIAIATAEKELAHLAERVRESLELARTYVLSQKSDDELYKKIHRTEEVTDAIQTEITVFLVRAQAERLTTEESTRAYGIIRAADELESVADYAASLARHRKRFKQSPEKLSSSEKNELAAYFDLVFAFYAEIENKLSTNSWELEKVREEAGRLTVEGNRIHADHKVRIHEGKSSPVAGMLFSDLIVSLRKVKSHSLNVAEAVCHAAMTDGDGA